MSTINDGGPVFPLAEPGNCVSASEGMSLRDYFAAKAMQAMISKHGREDDSPGFFDFATDESIARCAYIYADAMLAARKEKP